MRSGRPRPTPVRLLLPLVGLLGALGAAAAPANVRNTNIGADRPAPPVRLMAVGDSITAGAGFFSNYRFPLWEKLFAAGYVVEFVGTQQSESRVGPLAHEGYGGKNTEYLAATVPDHFRKHPADVVLLHSGHNHTVEEHPVPGILAATESLVAALRAANPRVTVLLAQVIPAGKLPKYAYLPELNAGLAELAARLDHPSQRVVLVDHAAGFDWRTDTVADRVHPNAAGAEKMATAWFDALRRVLPPPARAFAPQRRAYQQLAGGSLDLHIFPPTAGGATSARRPAVVFFFGGGWTHGTPLQFYPECAAFADHGYVAIAADYRVASTHGTTPYDALADARAALRWVRDHADELGVDPRRIVAAGASAGGQLAVAAALTAGDTGLRPAALLLWYPILDTGPGGYGHTQFGERFAEASPRHLLEANPSLLPPTLIQVGSEDRAVTAEIVHAFQARARQGGATCEVIFYPDAGHPLYAYRQGGGPLRDRTLAEAGAFLSRVRPLGWPAH